MAVWPVFPVSGIIAHSRSMVSGMTFSILMSQKGVKAQTSVLTVIEDSGH